MIGGYFHSGSGIGDQLFRYVTVRTLAEEKGFDWKIIGPFKGKDFMHIQTNWNERDVFLYDKTWSEKEIRDVQGNDIRSYDPEINFVQDNTIIDGCFEDEKYWKYNLHNIRDWLQTEDLMVAEDVCIVGFRGGEYAMVPDLFLTKDYWDEAIQLMRQRDPGMKFLVVTDDPLTARDMFPSFPITHEIGMDWRRVRNAQHSIISNSAFYVIPRLLQHLDNPKALTIAPRYWARRNTKVWARPSCYHKEFHFI